MKNFTLSEPTAFPDFNKKEGHDADHEITEIKLKTLKYKHFRSIMHIPEQDQMHHLMLEVTGLSDEDLGELTPDDTAEISAYIYESMKKYLQLGQKIMSGFEEK